MSLCYDGECKADHLLEQIDALEHRCADLEAGWDGLRCAKKTAEREAAALRVKLARMDKAAAEVMDDADEQENLARKAEAERDSLQRQLDEARARLAAVVGAACKYLDGEATRDALEGELDDAYGEAEGVSALIEAGRLATKLRLVGKTKVTTMDESYWGFTYEDRGELYDACAAIIEKEKGDG